jgi:hypothetical protein
MPIEITDRYKLIFEEHHYASDFRVKIIQGWRLFYGAFAAGLEAGSRTYAPASLRRGMGLLVPNPFPTVAPEVSGRESFQSC